MICVDVYYYMFEYADVWMCVFVCSFVHMCEYNYNGEYVCVWDCMCVLIFVKIFLY